MIGEIDAPTAYAKAYRKGYHAGATTGYNRGYTKGYEAALKEHGLWTEPLD
jgi:flagellar biosynthesis/type III secretory pathway protein FliH